MKKIFDQCTQQDFPQYLKERMTEYQAKRKKFSNPKAVFDYLSLVIYYLYVVRPKQEQSLASIMKLLGATYRERGYKTPFWGIVRKAANDYPKELLFFQGRQLEDQITNDDVEEMFDFLEYDILQETDDTEKEMDLGQLCICRVRYRQDRSNHIHMKRTAKEKDKETNEGFLELCKEFIDEYSPQKIKEYLDEYVIGQEETKKTLSAVLYNHYLRILNPQENLVKTNVLMIGPSGCGKTELIRRIMDLVNVPVVISDFSGVVATPWKGRNKEEALLNLYIKAGKDMALAECGIVFCDEFDKIIPTKDYLKNGDINNELQGQMLGMMEGTVMDIPFPVGQGAVANLSMNTKNILFICAGAFEGLDKIVEKDVADTTMGFGSEAKLQQTFEITQDNIKTEHLMKYGMKAELAGRIGTITVLQGLDRTAMKRVLLEPKDSILSKYENEFRVEEQVKLTFLPEALDVIIDRVLNMSIGARGLNSVIHDILAEALFEVPTMETVHEVLITKAAAELEEKPEYR